MKFITHFLLILLCLAALPAQAVTAGKVPSKQDIEQRLTELEQDTKIADDAKKARQKLYQSALENLSQGQEFVKQGDAYAADMVSDGHKITALKQEIDKIASQPDNQLKDISQQSPIAVIEQKLASAKSDRAGIESQVVELGTQYSNELKRPDRIYQQLAENKKELQRMEQEAGRLSAAASAQDRQAEAGAWQLLTRMLALEHQNISLNQELLRNPTRLEMLKLSQEKAGLMNEQIAKRITLLDEALNKAKLKDAEKTIAKESAIEAAVSDKSVVLQKLAEENLVLSKELTDIAEKSSEATQSISDSRTRIRDLEANFQQTKQKMEIAGMSRALGQLLVDQKRNLPDSGRIKRQVRDTDSAWAAIGLEQIQLSEARRQLRDLDQAVVDYLAPLPEYERADVKDDTTTLLARKRELLDKLIDGQSAYLQNLIELGASQRRLLELVNDFTNYLGEHLLWARSTPAVSLSDLAALPGEFLYLFDYQIWSQAVVEIAKMAIKSPPFILAMLVILLLVRYRVRLIKAVRDTGEMVGKPLDDQFKCTLKAVFYSSLVASPVPLAMLALVLLIRASADSSALTEEIAGAIRWIFFNTFFLLIFRALCIKGGVFERHFFWRPDLLRMIRKEIMWMLVLFVPATFLAALSAAALPNSWSGALIKAFLLSAVVVMGRFLYRMLEPNTGALQDFFQRYNNNAFARLRFIWKPLVLVGTLALMGAVLMGYLYAAAGFANYLIDTLVLVLLLVFCYELVERWLLMTQRRLAYKTALERHKALQTAHPEDEAEVPANKQPDHPKIDFVALSAETRVLMRAVLVVAAALGLWMIWNSALPALNVFNQVVLWYHLGVVAGVEQQLPVTLEDLLLALVIIATTYVTARNLPSLIEIMFLQRLQVSPGARYAVRTVTGYVILAIGIVATFNVVGGSWSQFQWLAAALGVGIGFGLQEIVANFISGLIVLFERPVRVGDYVTIGDAEGTVTRIQIRATTIETVENKELLVPNKEFITGRLLNWSLTDQVTRLTIAVGIAYGSDVDLAIRLMTDAATEHPAVLKDYPIRAFFLRFGDSALDLELRCFVGALDQRLQTLHDLNREINRKFADNGLDIPFPQRHMHLEFGKPLDVRVQNS